MEAENSTLINSIIGKGARVEGSFRFEGLLRIDGDFIGSIECHKGEVLIGPSGRIESDVSAKKIVVGGMVKGNLSATSSVVLLSTAVVFGDVQAPSILVEEGVMLSGHCKTEASKETAL